MTDTRLALDILVWPKLNVRATKGMGIEGYKVAAIFLHSLWERIEADVCDEVAEQVLQKGARVRIQTTNPRTIEFNGCSAVVITALKKQGKIYVAIDNSDRTPCFWASELIRLE